jgi:4-amino-4-deoxy-L-arabinose transferase-like glycosyltransferase
MTSHIRNTVTVLLFCIIVICGSYLRLNNLSSNPPQLFEDEIVNVLSARSILETGKDINGEINLFFYNRVESRSPVYGYVAALSTYIFGNNTFAIRFPAAVLGIISIVVIYLIVYKLSKDKQASLSAAFLTAIIPWQVHYSRVGWEPAATVPLLLISIYLFLLGLNKKWIILLSYLVFSVTIYTHRSAEVLSPLFLGILLLLNYKKVIINKLPNILGILIFLASFITLIAISVNDPNLHDRSLRISTFSDGVNIDSVKKFTENYFVHLSPDFLFINGDPNLRHGTGADGVIYLWMLPFISLGIVYLILNIKLKSSVLLLLWLLIFPLGGSLTNDGVPHATRTLIGGPALILISAFGVLYLKKILIIYKNGDIIYYSLLTIVAGLLLLQTYRFSGYYFLEYPNNSSIYWNYGNDEIFSYINQNSSSIKTACLENINYWDEEVLVRYYLPNVKARIIAGAEDPLCEVSGTLLVLNNPENREGCTTVKYIFSLAGEPMVNLCRVQ